MSLLEQMADSVSRQFQAWKSRLENLDFGGIADIRGYLPEVLADLILAAQATGGLGAEKRAAVLEAVGRWYDVVIAPKDMPGPDWLFDPIVRSGVVATANELIDGYVAVLKRFGVLKQVAA